MPAPDIPSGRRLAEYDYELPASSIAKSPVAARDHSGLLVLDRNLGTMEHRSFHELPHCLGPGDLVVLNETRVLPVRLLGRRRMGGAAEVLLVRPERPGEHWSEARRWVALVRPSARLKPGAEVTIGEGDSSPVRIVVGEATDDGMRLVEIGAPPGEVLERLGEMPLPPYIDRPSTARDRETYQTVYARVPGAVAAPTAGLHFTSDVFAALSARGVEVVKLVLHVGPGTFRPITVEDVAEHRVDPEWCEIPAETAVALERARADQRRIVAVGTTVTRALESWAREESRGAFRGWLDLFIRPPFAFQAVRALVTNFHLPRSSLLLLVSAFAGRERVLAAYREAIRAGYRFYSYGDAMLIQ